MDTGVWVAIALALGLIISLVLLDDRRVLSRVGAADRRAEELLQGALTEDQYRTLARAGYLAIESRLVPDRVYQIRRQGPVEVHERGQYQFSLCLQPLIPLPASDVVLLHKLLLEGDEQRYIDTANVVSRRVRVVGWS